MAEYIEREAVLDAIINDHQDLVFYAKREAIECIAAEPAADVVEVVHGRWTLNKDGSGTCNRCHFTQKNVWDMDNWQNFCGVCGARMDGE